MRQALAAGRVDILEASEALQEAVDYLKSLEDTRKRKFTILGVSDQAELRLLKTNKFLQSRMNALALKHRLRDRLRQRKFEIERLERAYRRTVNGVSSLILVNFIFTWPLLLFKQNKSRTNTFKVLLIGVHLQFKNWRRTTMIFAVLLQIW